jgi:hydrogenase maturation protease
VVRFTTAFAGRTGGVTEFRVTIFGVGSRMMRDERAGIAVLEELARRPLPQGVRLCETGTDGYGLATDLEETDVAVVVDCAAMGREPGAVVAFSPEEAESTFQDRRLSLHSLDVLSVIQLARQLGCKAEVRIVGIQPATVEVGDELSEAVAAAIPRAVALVEREIAAALRNRPAEHAE